MAHTCSRRRRCARGGIAVILLTVASGAAVAEQSRALDRFDLSIGGYYPSIDTAIGANTANDKFRGHFNLEDDLGFSKHKSVPRVRLNFLIGDSQGFSFDYFSVNRAHGQTLKRSFSYDGNNYDAMATVRGKLDFDFGSRLPLVVRAW